MSRSACWRQRGGAFSLALEFHSAGAGEYLRTGRSLSEETLDACRGAHAVLKGPVGDPQVRAPDGTEAGILGGVLRTGLDAYQHQAHPALPGGDLSLERGA